MTVTEIVPFVTHRFGEDHLPGLLHGLLAGLGFEEPSWTALFVVLIGVVFVVVGALAVRALAEAWW